MIRDKDPKPMPQLMTLHMALEVLCPSYQPLTTWPAGPASHLHSWACCSWSLLACGLSAPFRPAACGFSFTCSCCCNNVAPALLTLADKQGAVTAFSEQLHRWAAQ